MWQDFRDGDRPIKMMPGPTEMKDEPQQWRVDMWNVAARHRNREDSRLRPLNHRIQKGYRRECVLRIRLLNIGMELETCKE